MDKTTRPVAYEQFAALEAHGSHLCLLYEDNQDWLLGIRPFISTGLEANHKILYIASDHEEEEVLNLLSASGIDITKGLTSGQFCILPRDRYYMLNGYFDPDRTIRIIISEAKKALSEGYSALRITGETGWAFSNMADSVNLFDYEEKINSEIYDVYPCLAVCQYDMSRLNPEIMQKIIRTHSRIIYKGQILQNYNYVPMSGSKKGQRSAEEVKLWLEQIKEQLSSQYALEERERKFRLLFDTMSQGVIYVDESGAITSANPAAVNILGVTSEQLMRYGAQVPEHNYIRMDGSVITANQMPSATALNSGQAVNNFIMGFHRSGEQDLRWINVSSIPQFRPYSDRPSGVYSTFTDITDLVNSRKALAESEAKYRRIAEGMSDVVWTSDLEMKTTYVSPSVEKMMGEPAERHLGRKVEEKFPPRDILKLQDMLREELKMDATPGVSKNRSRIIELEHYKADGSLIWVSIHVSFLRDEKGNIVGIHGITRDISAFKKMEEEARLARDKAEVSARLATVGEMAAGIAHEINNPP
jgi:PAS domain S-box-containing protein